MMIYNAHTGWREVIEEAHPIPDMGNQGKPWHGITDDPTYGGIRKIHGNTLRDNMSAKENAAADKAISGAKHLKRERNMQAEEYLKMALSEFKQSGCTLKQIRSAFERNLFDYFVH